MRLRHAAAPQLDKKRIKSLHENAAAKRSLVFTPILNICHGNSAVIKIWRHELSKPISDSESISVNSGPSFSAHQFRQSTKPPNTVNFKRFLPGFSHLRKVKLALNMPTVEEPDCHSVLKPQESPLTLSPRTPSATTVRERSWAICWPHTAASSDTWAWVWTFPEWAASDTRAADGRGVPAREARGEETPGKQVVRR